MKINEKSKMFNIAKKKLMNGKRLNTYMFEKLTGSQRLAVCINYFRSKLKWDITDRWVYWHPRGRYIKQYWLKPEEINRIENQRAANSGKVAANVLEGM